MPFVVPVLVPFFRDEMGLSFKDFMIGEAAMAAMVVLLDVPTGWLSDIWKRKHVLALGTVLLLIGNLLMLVAHNLVTAVSAQSVMGIGLSLLNGTNNGLLYETLMSEQREGEYRRREGRRQGLGLYAMAAASILGGLMYPYPINSPWNSL